MNTPWRPARVLLVDDSALVRKLVRDQIGADDRLEVVGVAASVGAARETMAATGPDVLLVDNNLGDGTGIALIRELMSTSPIPSVLFSSSINADTRRRALRQGAVAVVQKPASLVQEPDFWQALGRTLRQAAKANLRGLATSTQPSQVIGVAISTGGPPVVARMLSELPATLPPIVIVQHMRDAFIERFVQQLGRVTAIRVGVAQPGQVLLAGHCYVAPGGHQTRVAVQGGALRLSLGPPTPVSGHAPSGDALLYSIAYSVGGASVGAVLTGMGVDGAAGLLAMRRAGARTLAQDQATSTVFGMPRVAAEYGGARRIVPLEAIAQALQTSALGR